MKKIYVTILGLSLVYASYAQTTEKKPTVTTEKVAPVLDNNQPAPKDINKVLEFQNAEYDFGKIPQGKPVEYDVNVKNISKDTVVLDRVQVSCGCTTPKYEQGQKIAPGKTAKVTLGFNGAASGAFQKYITFFFNNSSLQKQVTFKGETFTAPAAPAPANTTNEKMKAE